MFNQSRGISTVALIVIVAIIGVALIGGIAVVLYSVGQGANNTTTSSPEQYADKTPESYHSNQDLDAATKELDSLDINRAIDEPLEEIDANAEQF